jgi:hypothetical protein
MEYRNLAPADIAEYLRCPAVRCPYCQSPRLFEDYHEACFYSDGEILRTRWCRDCEHNWTEVYRLLTDEDLFQHCPCCRNQHGVLTSDHDDEDLKDGLIHAARHCEVCTHEWTIVYRLVDVEESEYVCPRCMETIVEGDRIDTNSRWGHPRGIHHLVCPSRLAAPSP